MIWDTSFVYGILVLCTEYESYVWDISFMFWEKSKSHVTRVQLWRSVLSYVWDTSLMFGIFVLCMGYWSYVWDICLMYGILVLCMGY